MIYFTPQDAVELFGGNEGRQVIDYITKQGCGRREYLVGNTWQPEPTGKIAGQRYNFGEDGKLPENVLAVAETWKYVKRNGVESPERPDKVLEQLTDARLKSQQLRLFSPWGPRYKKGSPKIKPSDPEIKTLEEVRDVLSMLNGVGYFTEYLLMPADVYGTEINNLSSQFVKEYFAQLSGAATAIFGGMTRLTIKPWSEIRDENYELYKMWFSLAALDFSNLVKAGELEKAVRVAQNFSAKNPEESARKYCMERLVEAALIADLYDPIKLSLVRKEKDALDGPLKRLYVIKNRAPWLEGE
ncbi:MAG: hypothetical protein HY515_03735 [Candidatus Aenigmarchaeota archaeon]|nr:hypothetical protein [Candidatus Aenigmarchaeota archaeon]